jgi:VanZ family protein
VVYAAGILVATSVPVPAGLPAPENSDKLVHSLMYAGLGALFLKALLHKPAAREQRRRVAALCILTTFACCSLFGAFDEWHQQFVGRTMAFTDWVADAVGALAGAVGMVWYLQRDRRDVRRTRHVGSEAD